ncbi:MAG: hypothetical protein K2K96_02705 [Lachnospiraceae bacterium]|nr:hypothetical protein [Lachnospiraceae bacterium]
MRKWMNRAAVGILAAIVLSGTTFAAFGMYARAEKSDYDDDDFTIDAELSVSASSESFNIEIEVTNDGPDFEGTVRLIAENGGNDTCAYDTAISLSEGSTKQFVVSIPVSSLDTYYSGYGQTGTMYVILLDHKGNRVTTEKFTRFFQDYQEKVVIGVLSDAYAELSYLDANGYAMYIINNNYAIELVELSKDTLADGLERLDYLIIDQYDTSLLNAETVSAVEDWTDHGGMLIFGTGNYAYDVLSGFDQQFLQTECLGIYEAITGNFETEKGYGMDMYSVTGSYSPYDYYGISIDMYIPSVYETDTAILSGFSQYDMNYHYGSGYASSISYGNGSITYLYYALSDPEIAAACATTNYVTENILEMAADQTMLDYATFHNTEDGIRYSYSLTSALGIIDMEKSNINYNVLKALIILYVILVGPIVYLVLSRLKKRELYWVAVPAMALLFVGVVSIAGRGFRIADTTVCSVTFVDAGDTGDTGSVLYAYSAGHDDWQVALAGECAYAGPLQSNYGWTSDPTDYYFHVIEDMSGTSIGIRPDASFETAMFQRKAAEPTEGELLVEDIEVTTHNVKGYVTNETGYDFSYMLVYDNRYFAVVEGVEDGERINLRNADVISQANVSSIDDVFWRTAEQEYEENKTLAAQMAALYIGLMQSIDFGGTVVVGVVPNYDRVTAGNCAENSYGVFYSIQDIY